MAAPDLGVLHRNDPPVVVGTATTVEEADTVARAGAEVVAVPEGQWSDELVVAVCDRVRVPVVALATDPSRLLVPGGDPVPVTCVGDAASVAAAVLAGARVVVADDVRAARRVVEVVRRLRHARSDS